MHRYGPGKRVGARFEEVGWNDQIEGAATLEEVDSEGKGDAIRQWRRRAVQGVDEFGEVRQFDQSVVVEVALLATGTDGAVKACRQDPVIRQVHIAVAVKISDAEEVALIRDLVVVEVLAEAQCDVEYVRSPAVVAVQSAKTTPHRTVGTRSLRDTVQQPTVLLLGVDAAPVRQAAGNRLDLQARCNREREVHAHRSRPRVQHQVVRACCQVLIGEQQLVAGVRVRVRGNARIGRRATAVESNAAPNGVRGHRDVHANVPGDDQLVDDVLTLVVVSQARSVIVIDAATGRLVRVAVRQSGRQGHHDRVATIVPGRGKCRRGAGRQHARTQKYDP